MHPDLLHFTPGKAGAEKVLLAIKWRSGRKPEAEPGLLRGGRAEVSVGDPQDASHARQRVACIMEVSYHASRERERESVCC